MTELKKLHTWQFSFAAFVNMYFFFAPHIETISLKSGLQAASFTQKPA